jgi:hypothetical protein
MRITANTNRIRKKSRVADMKIPWLCQRHSIQLSHDNAVPLPIAAAAIDLLPT